jgi:hypothetical protein
MLSISTWITYVIASRWNSGNHQPQQSYSTERLNFRGVRHTLEYFSIALKQLTDFWLAHENFDNNYAAFIAYIFHF